MKTSILRSALLVGLTVALFAFDLPTGWIRAGSKPASYEMGVDKGAGQDGKNAATIKSIEQKIDGFGTLMQTARPGKFLGKRIRMTALVKSENVTGWSGLWLRVDQPNAERPLSFDNMYNRSIKGTTAWTSYQIVLDVADDAIAIAYGGMLNGTGQIWFDNITFEIVDASVPVTGSGSRIGPPNESTNLDFEK